MFALKVQPDSIKDVASRDYRGSFIELTTFIEQQKKFFE